MAASSTTTRTVTLGSLTFPVRSAGPDDGVPVVLLHGFPQTSAMWEPALTALADAGYRALAPDQRGYAPTAQPHRRSAYRMEALADDVIGIGDALGLDRFHVVGHDWGGAVGWHLAARDADRLRSFVSVSTPHPRAMARAMHRGQALRSLYIPFFRMPWLPERLLGAGGHRGLGRALERSGLPADRAREVARSMEATGALPWALAWYRANGPGLAATGPSLVPTMYVWSTGDTALGRAAAERTGDHVEAPYRFVVLEGVSHWIPDVAPDDLHRHLLEHLERHPGHGAP
ncbi:MAG: alpha/beta fold hydrolase [Actinobacteria bacterium]|nr:alpha/beta fold hydrolase [Actinomycetota bacterium]